MRLLGLDSAGQIKLSKNFIGEEIPRYAILSHTWAADEEEVTFKDLQEGSGRNKAGYVKIQFCSKQASKDGIHYFWVDTCCIDKADHSELSEAITSMFRWYRDAVKCYVYLADVSARKRNNSGEVQRSWEAAFRTSRWFTRGWTLQELIAPKEVEIFSREGDFLGTKITLEDQIQQVTSIPVAALRGAPISGFSVDERMRWSEGRDTRRKEDKAYCLLGIFNVFMPLIYGEGENALIRLKKKIDKPSEYKVENKTTQDAFVLQSPNHEVALGRSGNVHQQNESNQHKARDSILRSLWYPRMKDRIDQVKQTHGATYKWVLEHNADIVAGPVDTAKFSSSPSQKDWDKYKSIIEDIYMRGNMPMRELLEYMRSHHNFTASFGMYKSKLLKWGCHRYSTVKNKRDKWENYKPDFKLENRSFRKSNMPVEMQLPRNDFSSWLKSKDTHKTIYWVSGKVGSGKSTLMRYLDTSINQNEHVHPWAEGLRVLRAQYFFWNPATNSLQKSLVGLLRSLMFQLFEQAPELIGSSVVPEKWRTAQRDEAFLDWTSVKLQETMKKYLDSTCNSFRILLIIDGLDEVEGDSQDAEDLLSFLNETSNHSHIKICVSSRPWIVFQDAFHGCPKLTLEELTYADIQSFVLETLKSHQRFRYIQRLDPTGSKQLANRVVQKAEGVFLWATLVVRELMQHLRDGEGIQELHKTLDGIPADLNGHFRRLINSVPSMHRKEAFILFQIALHHEQDFSMVNPLRLLDLSFLDAAGTDFAFFRQSEKSGLDFSDREAVLFRLDSTLRKLNSRCLGILECFYSPGETASMLAVPYDDYEPPLNSQTAYEENLEDPIFLPMIQNIASTRQHKLFAFDFAVDFLHRSLREFMIIDGLQLLHEYSDSDFDLRNFLLNARLVQAQQIQAVKLCTPLATGFCSDVLSMLSLPEYRFSENSAALARKLRNTVESIPGCADYLPSFWYLNASLNAWQSECSSFLTVAIDFNLEAYIEEHFNQPSTLEKRGRPVLDYILRPRFAGETSRDLQIGYQTPSVNLIQHALDNGSDPNQQWDGSSIWALFLCFIVTVVQHVESTAEQRQNYFEALIVLIDHGASPQLPRSSLCGEAYFEMFQDPWPDIAASADERFESRWGAVEESTARGDNDDGLYNVRSLVECFIHPNIFDVEQVRHLQLLLDRKKSDSASPSPTQVSADNE